MGYEVAFYYYERSNEQEEFDKSEDSLKHRVVKIGDAAVDISMERVAATILKEYTKPNIWVDKVEVVEWIQKPLKFTETKSGGIKLGQKTFNLGLNEIMKLAVEDAPKPSITTQQQHYQQPPQQQHYPPQQQQLYIPQQPPQRKVWPHEMMSVGQINGQMTYATNSNDAYPGQEMDRNYGLNNKTSAAGLMYAQRVEVCDPPPELRSDLAGLSLTLGKQYKVMEEQLARNGRDYVYKIINDKGHESLVGWHYFRQPQLMREEVSYYDRSGNLRTATNYVDQSAHEPNVSRPRLTYEQEQQPLYRPVLDNQGSNVENMMARMDAAIRRRTAR